LSDNRLYLVLIISLQAMPFFGGANKNILSMTFFPLMPLTLGRLRCPDLEQRQLQEMSLMKTGSRTLSLIAKKPG